MPSVDVKWAPVQEWGTIASSILAGIGPPITTHRLIGRRNRTYIKPAGVRLPNASVSGQPSSSTEAEQSRQSAASAMTGRENPRVAPSNAAPDGRILRAALRIFLENVIRDTVRWHLLHGNRDRRVTAADVTEAVRRQRGRISVLVLPTRRIQNTALLGATQCIVFRWS